MSDGFDQRRMAMAENGASVAEKVIDELIPVGVPDA